MSTQVSWDDDSVQASQGNRRDIVQFKGIAGHTQRILLIDTAAVMVKQHYHRPSRKYIRCIKDTNNGYCPACDAIGQPTQSFASNVIVFETTPDGTPIRDANGFPKFKVAIWKFGADKFVLLRDLRKEWGDLRKHDLVVSCSDAQFQRLTIVPAASALWLSDQTFQNMVVETYKRDKYDLDKLMGKLMSPADIIATLNGTPVEQNQNQGYQQQPQHNQPQYSQPQYQAPQYQAPQYQAPAPQPAPQQANQNLGVPDFDVIYYYI
jgi:hypothetical protein